MTTPNTPRTPAEQSGNSGSLDRAETVSLADLKSKRAAMRECVFPDGEDIVVTRIRKEWRPDLRDALVATHNAADVLIEIAEAALAWHASDDEDRAPELDRLLAAIAKVTP